MGNFQDVTEALGVVGVLTFGWSGDSGVMKVWSAMGLLQSRKELFNI